MEEEINAENDGEEEDENMFHLSKEDIDPAETVSKEEYKQILARRICQEISFPKRYKPDCETIQAKLCSDAIDNGLEKYE